MRNDLLAVFANANVRLNLRVACLSVIALLGIGVGANQVYAQTQMPMPAQTSTFTGNSRGYWFTAPTNMVITGVEVPTTASSGNQNVAVLRLNATPPLFSATTNDFTQLFLTQNNSTSGMIPTKLAVATNDIIGVLGDRGGVNSYSNVGNTTTIDSFTVPLTRLGMQFPLATTAPQQVWQEATSNISRVWLYYQVGFLVSGAASPTAGGTVNCSPDILAPNTTTECAVTPNAGYTLTGVSGCGVTATSPPYTTAPATAHCTVTATFVAGATVGGTVTGLSGSGLALSLNGTETLPIGANGNFTFASTVANGNPYTVTVQTQPSSPSQTCTVANGSGTAAASNITNVAVTCTTNTYTVGGNVSGLSGSGLVLSLNGGAQTISPNVNGTFSFPTALASGSTYSVSVQTQPSSPTQTCSVSSPSGTITSANVTDISVSCSTNTYTVGGNVNGLLGSGLVLSLNGGAQTLNVAADGGFTFPTALASGATYSVSVQTQPSSPAQTCSVSSASGTVASANVTGVVVSCGTNAYTVGGSVSGLAGSGLVLSLNGGAQTLNVAANGNFSFPVAITSGGTYNVSVQTQPSSPTQTCSVTSASGTVAGANITSVVVSCSTNAFTVGGSVSGLSGSGLVLSLNGGAQTLNVAANGNFTFPAAIPSGSSYSVSVQTQPSTPAQSCSVTDGSGTVGSANVTNISVQCGILQRTVTLTSTFSNVSTTPTIPATVVDGTVLSFTLNVPAGFTLLGASGCGGTLSGNLYTTAPITANCSITVSLAAIAAQQVPMFSSGSLAALAFLLFCVVALGRRRLR